MADRRTLRAVAAHAGDQHGGRHARHLRDTDTEQHTARAYAAETLTDWLNDPRRLSLLSSFGSRVLARDVGFQEVMAPVESAVLEEVRIRRAQGARDGEGILSLLEQAYDENGAPMSEQEAARRTDHAALRWPDRDLAVMGLRAAAAPPREARVPALGGAGRRRRDLRRRGRQRDVAPVSGGPARDAEACRPMEFGGYMIPAGATVAPCIYLVHLREDIYPHPARSCPSGSWSIRLALTPGFPLAAGCGAASPRVRSAGDEARDAGRCSAGRAGPSARVLLTACDAELRFPSRQETGRPWSSSAGWQAGSAVRTSNWELSTAPLAARRTSRRRVRRRSGTRPRL